MPAPFSFSLHRALKPTGDLFEDAVFLNPPRTKTQPTGAVSGPEKSWKSEICDCCNDGCTYIGCCSCCCTPAMIGQAYQRVSEQPNSRLAKVCPTLPAFCCWFLWAFWFVSYAAYAGTSFLAVNEPWVVFATGLTALAASITLVCVLCQVRFAVRKRDNIQLNGPCNDCCFGRCDDCCLSFWCMCCTVCQLYAQDEIGNKDYALFQHDGQTQEARDRDAAPTTDPSVAVTVRSVPGA